MRTRRDQQAGRSRRWIVLGLLLLAATPSRAAEEPGNDACLACHAADDLAGASGRRLAPVRGDAYGRAAHGALPCTACHADAATLPHAAPPAKVETAPCALCHGEAVTTYRRSVHGGVEGHAPPAATCADCHGDLHAVVPEREQGSPVHWSRLADTCARCHGAVEGADGRRVPVVRPVEAYLQSAHARAIHEGRRAAMCSDCHGSHGIFRGTDPQSTIWRANVPGTCGTCHTEILATYQGSVHGEALARGRREAPVCTDCHGEHRILGASEPASPVFAANIPGETCGRCHANERLGAKYGLSLGNVSTFQDSYHGLALRAGQLTVANCSSCHGIHDIRPSSDPRSHVHPANLAQTCGRCHPGAGTRFELGAVHGGPASTGAVAAGWIRAVYLWLIGLTIGAMAVHNLLDLARKARFPAPPPPVIPTPPTERMTRSLRWQHGLVMLTFPVLVYTGFALTYPEAWWAAPLLRWEAAWGVRGRLHRIAAVVMTVALAWHLVQLAVSRRLRGCMRGILPSTHDVRALFGTLAYHLGRRPRPPHSGAFNYAEKAEYWAFMWGTVLMTGTGLLLWFENATLTWLPGWVPEVATAVHFWEAVLATLAIVVWHFYWVIFDPVVYPMDWTWWTGRPPAARVHERTAEETPLPPVDVRAGEPGDAP